MRSKRMETSSKSTSRKCTIWSSRRSRPGKSLSWQACFDKESEPLPEFKILTELRPINSAGMQSNTQSNGNFNEPEEGSLGQALTGQANLSISSPLRLPHIDYTPLGARQVIRSQQQDIRDVAMQASIISYEDAICKEQPFTATAKESDPLIAANYNPAHELGPRYAVFSIWRPLSKVFRDPMSFAPRNKPLGDGYVPWPYLNKIPGAPELGGDYLKEYIMLRVESREEIEQAPQADGNAASAPPQWYYVSDQEPDEDLFVQLFDSASLEPCPRQPPVPWHASPEIGGEFGEHPPRESIDMRVMVFW